MCVCVRMRGREEEIDRTQILCTHNLSVSIMIWKDSIWWRNSTEFWKLNSVYMCVKMHTRDTQGKSCAKERRGGQSICHKSLPTFGFNMFKCLEMRTSCITFERLSSLSVWCVPVCLEKLCFHFGLFISLPLMRCHSRAFTLHFYLILGVMKVRKMCLELSLWPVFFFFFFFFWSAVALIKF